MVEVKLHLRIYLKSIFGFVKKLELNIPTFAYMIPMINVVVENQEMAFYCKLQKILTLTLLNRT